MRESSRNLIKKKKKKKKKKKVEFLNKNDKILPDCQDGVRLRSIPVTYNRGYFTPPKE